VSDPGLLRFPDGFLWGTTTAAYPIEGAWNEDDKSPSIWDTFCRQPGKIRRGENAKVATDHYHRYLDEVRLMAELGLEAYCFSVAWSRVIPQGTSVVNSAGLDFYDRLVDALLDNGVEPLPVLYHWGLPQCLQDRGGWPKRDTASHFADYETRRRIVEDSGRWLARVIQDNALEPHA
jgi:beta-glucosidase